MFFFFKYINFYFLNEGYFWKFIQLLGAPSNTPKYPHQSIHFLLVWVTLSKYIQPVNLGNYLTHPTFYLVHLQIF